MTDNGLKVGEMVDAEVMKIHDFGAIVKFGSRRGLIHISQISDDYVDKVSNFLKIGDKVRARIKKVTPDGKVDLSLKRKKKPAQPAPISREKEFRITPFEDKMEKYYNKSKQQKGTGSDKAAE